MLDHKLDEEIKLSIAETPSSICESGLAESQPTLRVSNCDEQGQDFPQNSYDISMSAVKSNFEKFQLSQATSEDALGITYGARSEFFKEDIAVKVISSNFASDEKSIERILMGLKVAAEVNHPNLSSIYDSGRAENHGVYFVTDASVTKTLFEQFANGPMDVDRFLDVFRQVCQGLKTLHQRKLLHGNLTPANVMVSSDNPNCSYVKLLNYGIVSTFNADQREEFVRHESKSSAANYLSPEHCLGYDLDQRSDIYSLGLLMYQALTGQPLVAGQTRMHTILKQLTLKPKSLRQFRQDIPESLEKIVFKCLEKNRSDRYFCIDDLELELDLAAAENHEIAAIGDNRLTPIENKVAAQSKKHNLLLVAISATVCSFLVASMTVAITGISHGHGHSTRHRNHFYNSNYAYLPNQQIVNVSSSDDCVRQAEKMIAGAVAIEGPDSTGAVTLSPKAMLAYESATNWYKQAVDRYQNEVPATDPNFNKRMAELETFVGESYNRTRYETNGGFMDPENFGFNYFGALNPTGVMLEPAFPGRNATAFLKPDYKTADLWFQKALNRLDHKYDGSSLGLLWDNALNKFKLGELDESIKMHRVILEGLSANHVKVDTTILAQFNLGRLYLAAGEPGKAVHEFKIARDLDRNAHRVYGTGNFTDNVNADLAYAFLSEGKVHDALKIAKRNVKDIEHSNLDTNALFGTVSGDAYALNLRTMALGLSSQGKYKQAQKYWDKVKSLYNGPPEVIVTDSAKSSSPVAQIPGPAPVITLEAKP